MNFEQYLMEVLKNELEEMFINKMGIKEDEIEQIYKDSNGEFFNSDGEFIIAHRKEIFTEELMNSMHMFITKIDLLEDDNVNKLVAYLASQFYIRHYGIEKDMPVLKYLVNTDMQATTELFMENDGFGKALISSFFANACDPERFYENKEQIKIDGKMADLDRFYNIAFPPKIFTLNQKLREIVCNLYEHYISRGYPDKEALDITWEYFLHGLDPLNQLEELGCTDEEEKRSYRYYTLSLMIADLYEDFANEPLVKTDNPNGVTAQVIPVFLTVMGRVRIPRVPEVRERMLKYFILLQNVPDKMKSNRERTHAEGREKTLKKVNPTFLLDELTF